MLLERMTILENENPQHVLILIVMEDALRGQISKFPDIPNPLSLFM